MFLAIRPWLTVAVWYFWLQPEEKEQKAPYENLFYRLHPSPNTHSSPVVPLYWGCLDRLQVHFPEFPSFHGCTLWLAVGEKCKSFGRWR